MKSIISINLLNIWKSNKIIIQMNLQIAGSFPIAQNISIYLLLLCFSQRLTDSKQKIITYERNGIWKPIRPYDYTNRLHRIFWADTQIETQF